MILLFDVSGVNSNYRKLNTPTHIENILTLEYILYDNYYNKIEHNSMIIKPDINSNINSRKNIYGITKDIAYGSGRKIELVLEKLQDLLNMSDFYIMFDYNYNVNLILNEFLRHDKYENSKLSYKDELIFDSDEEISNMNINYMLVYNRFNNTKSLDLQDTYMLINNINSNIIHTKSIADFYDTLFDDKEYHLNDLQLLEKCYFELMKLSYIDNNE